MALKEGESWRLHHSCHPGFHLHGYVASFCSECPEWEREARRGKEGKISGVVMAGQGPPRSLFPASSANLPAGGIICGQDWKVTHVSGHSGGQVEGGHRKRGSHAWLA